MLLRIDVGGVILMNTTLEDEVRYLFNKVGYYMMTVSQKHYNNEYILIEKTGVLTPKEVFKHFESRVKSHVASVKASGRKRGVKNRFERTVFLPREYNQKKPKIFSDFNRLCDKSSMNFMVTMNKNKNRIKLIHIKDEEKEYS